MSDGVSLIDLTKRLAQARVLVVGDVMLDRFVYGRVDRISPEAPIPVLRVEDEDAMLGGAGNVARNLSGLGAQADFVAAVGDDEAGRTVRSLLGDLAGVDAHLVETGTRPTAIKTRYLAGTQQLMRADKEETGPLATDEEKALIDAAIRAMETCTVVVLSDYGKGVLSDAVLSALIDAATARKLPVIVDPKGTDYTRYRGATLLTPNRKELADATGMATGGDDAIIQACRHLINTAGVLGVLATRSQEGMTLLDGDDVPVHLPARAREVFDVSGAGDTVVATMAAALAAQADKASAAMLANVAAGIVVAKVGTAAVYADDLTDAIHHQDVADAEAKVLSWDQARDRIALWRRQGLSVGFTNGCFDILHAGHVTLLDRARATCDRLILGLNSDASVHRLKGEGRPVNAEGARATVLAALASVDAVVIFDEDTPLDLITALMPDVLIKGADYTRDQVVGADVVEAGGGRVALVDLVEGHSTTATINRIKD